MTQNFSEQCARMLTNTMMQTYSRPSISVADVKISDVVRLSGAPNRLRNCITQTHERHELPVETIGAYLAGYPATERQFRDIRSLGRKTARELTDLLRKWNEAAHATSNRISFARRIGLPDHSVFELKKAGVIALEGSYPNSTLITPSVADVKISDVVRLSEVSVRLST